MIYKQITKHIEPQFQIRVYQKIFPKIDYNLQNEKYQIQGQAIRNNDQDRNLQLIANLENEIQNLQDENLKLKNLSKKEIDQFAKTNIEFNKINERTKNDLRTNQQTFMEKIQKWQHTIQKIVNFFEEIYEPSKKPNRPYSNRQNINQIETQCKEFENIIFKLENQIQTNLIYIIPSQIDKLQQNNIEYKEINTQLKEELKQYENQQKQLNAQIEYKQTQQQEQQLLYQQQTQELQNQINKLQNDLNEQIQINKDFNLSTDELRQQKVGQYVICELLDEIQSFYYLGFFNILQPNLQIWEVLQQVQTQIVQKIIEKKFNNYPQIQELEKICWQCQQQLGENVDIIELPCHMYHEKCFIELVEKQIEYRYPQLSCICDCCNINPSKFFNLRDQGVALQLCKKFQNVFDEQHN